MFKRKLLLFLIMLSSLGVSAQITPQWKSVTGGLMSYFYPGKTPNGFDTLWNAQTIRAYVGGSYTANNGITLTGHNFALGGALTGTTAVTFTNYGLGLGDLTTQKSFVIIDPTTSAVSMRGASATSASTLTISKAGFTFLNIHGGSNQMAISADTLSGMSVTDQQFNTGLIYNSDYSTIGKTNNRWIPDWGAVKSLIPAGGVISSDSALHVNKNLNDVANKATALANLSGVPFVNPSTINNLYNQTTWNNFNDFTAQGNYTLVNGNIHVTAMQSDILATNYVTSLSNFTLSYTYKATNGASNAAGLPGGIKTINVVATTIGFRFWFDESTRKINVFNNSTSTTTTGTSVLPSYTPGDVLILSVTYTNPTEIFTLTNQTTGQSISMSGTSLMSINRGNIAVFPQTTSVAYDILNITLSTGYKYGGNLFVGDSIDNGLSATPGSGYTFQLNGQIQAGNGDYTVQVLAGLSEIIKLKPETIYLKIGTNDSFFSIWQANVVNIVSTLQNAGIRVVLISPPPRNTIDMSPYLAFLQSQYPTQTIDIFTPLKAVSGTGYNAAYDSGDGIHPNQAGHNLIATTVSSNSLWHTAVYSKVIPTDILASRLTTTNVVPGYYNGLSSFRVRSDGRVENASTLGVQTNLGAMYYKTGGTIGVSSQVTVNGSAIVANTFYGNSTWAATSQGTNSLSFLTASNSNLVARMFNSGGMTVGVGLTSDPGANVLSVLGPVLANSFYGTSNWTATAQGTNFLSFLTQSNSHLVARMFDSGGMTVGFGLSADPGANTLSVAGGAIAARFQGQSTASLTSVGTNFVQIATQSNTNVVARHFDSGGATVGLGLSTDPGANNFRAGSNIMGQSFSLLGNASGQININPQNAAGTYNFNLPITAGTAGQVLTSQAGGSTAMTWTTPVGFANPMTTLGDIFIGGASGTPSRLADVAIGNVLKAGGVATAPAYGKVTSSEIDATVMANPLTTTGDIVYGTGTTPTRLAAGTSGQVLTSNGSSTAPSWQTPSGGGSGIQRLTSFYTNVVAGTTETDLYDYTIPANTLSANGSMIEGQYNGEYSTTGPTDLAWINVYFAGQQILAATSLNGVLSLTVRIFKTGTSTARADCILVSATNGGFVNSRTFQTTTDLTGLDFTTTNPLLTKGYNTVGTLTYKDGIVKINP